MIGSPFPAVGTVVYQAALNILAKVEKVDGGVASVVVLDKAHQPTSEKVDLLVMSISLPTKVIGLTCGCCGDYYRGRQWWNQDYGYGVCASCVQSFQPDQARESFGCAGYHYDLPQFAGQSA